MILNTFSTKLQARGLGNFIQGSYSLHNICQSLNIDFGIDFSDHPIVDYLVPQIIAIDKRQTEIYDISSRKDLSRKDFDQTTKFIHGLYSIYTRNGYDHVRFYSIQYPLHEDIKYDCALSRYFLPNETANDLIKKEFSYDDYEIIHVRCGDHNAFRNSNCSYIDNIISSIEQDIVSIKNNTKSPILLISDSYELKTKLSAIHDFHIINNIPSHSTKYNDFFYEVALDFFLLCKARSIHQFCIYKRESSFSYWPHVLFNIPFYFYDTLSTFRE
jgi:hypothetical protein